MNTRRQRSLAVTLEVAYHKSNSSDDDSGGRQLESGSMDDGGGGQMESAIRSGMAGYLRVKVLVSVLELKSGSSKLDLSKAMQLTRVRYIRPTFLLHTPAPFQVQVHFCFPRVLPPHYFLHQLPPP